MAIGRGGNHRGHVSDNDGTMTLLAIRSQSTDPFPDDSRSLESHFSATFLLRVKSTESGRNREEDDAANGCDWVRACVVRVRVKILFP